MKYIVGFSRKMHFFARAIMWFTKSEVSHCYVRQDGDGAAYVLEATSKGVNLQWHSVFLRNKAIVVKEFEVNWPEENLEVAWAITCYERLNLKYGWLTILGDAYVYFRFWLTKKWVKNPFPGPWKDVCSELVLSWLLEARMTHEFGQLDPNTIAPSDAYSGQPGLLQVVELHPEIFKPVEVGT